MKKAREMAEKAVLYKKRRNQMEKQLFVVVVTEPYCCPDCSVRETRWMPKEVRGPFASCEEAALCLKELGFQGPRGRPTDPIIPPHGRPGFLWRTSQINAVICPLMQ